MRRSFTLEYWQDGALIVGRLLEVPGVFSQGETLDELRENIQDAYELRQEFIRQSVRVVGEPYVENSSRDSPDWRMIERSVPTRTTSWSGTITLVVPSSVTRCITM
jgi:hypothetical protein